MVKPIPKRLLTHKATIQTPSGHDAWQQETYTEPVALSYVRIEPCSGVVLNKDNVQTQLSGTLFYCCKHSRPAGLHFVPGQKVQFGAREYTVMTVQPLYDAQTLHHWELGLQ